jgi:hypothetical protein
MVMLIVPRSTLRLMRSDRFANARLAPSRESTVPQRTSVPLDGNSLQRSSTRAVVVFDANDNSSPSLSAPATREMARTFEYDKAPVANLAATSGKVFNVCYSNFLTGGIHEQVASIVQPLGAVSEAPFQPAGTLVELSNQYEQLVSFGIDSGGKSDDGAIKIVDGWQVWERFHGTSLWQEKDL